MEHNVYAKGLCGISSNVTIQLWFRIALSARLCWQFSGWQEVAAVVVPNNNENLAGLTDALYQH